MTLIKSISGIRGIVGDGLTPPEIVRFTSAYVNYIRQENAEKRLKIVVGRDARVSGQMVSAMVCSILMSCGADVIDLGLATTPTVEMAVKSYGADGGIIITASHNPAQWNALKLLNEKGEFLSAAAGETILQLAERNDFGYMGYRDIGTCQQDNNYLVTHINKILALPLVNKIAIERAGFRIAFDAVNSVGGLALPALLKALGVKEIIPLNANPDGLFAHNPEPLPEHLAGICSLVKQTGADAGFVVDPDVDRLAIITETGGFFGEEYTLVAVADYILKHESGNTVSNLSSTRALKDVTERYGGQYFASAVGEVNVVEMMKKTRAVIGGEGNGGVIYPDLHYGRDALVGIALFLSHLATSGITCSDLRKTYPDYFISKNKVILKPGSNPSDILVHIKKIYKDFPMNDSDGIRIDFPEGWVHIRQSNTEPIMRIYSEAAAMSVAEQLAGRIRMDISQWIC